MLRNMIAKIMNLAFFSLLPFVWGCQGGGGGSASLGGAATVALADSGTGGTIISTPETIATIHNPEPATMLLLGSGLVAMNYFGKKLNKKR